MSTELIDETCDMLGSENMKRTLGVQTIGESVQGHGVSLGTFKGITQNGH